MPTDGVSVVPGEILRVPEMRELTRISEVVPENSNLVFLKKDFWIGRKIWMSIGIERASLTGLANSVIGFIPAEIERAGTDLILKRRNQGLFGGSTLGPDLLINTYPILSENESAILVDLSKPRSGYGLSSVGFYAGSDSATELQPRVDYLKNIEVRDNGVGFTNVIVAKSPVALFAPNDGSAEGQAGLDPFLLSATLRTDWITELESPNFSPLPLSDGLFGFFIDLPQVISSGTATESFVNQIDAGKEMKWSISANTPAAYVDAVKKGVLSWNVAFGKDVLSVSLAEKTVSFTDPATSNVTWDDNEAVGMAFANWRSNPYTGEIVQAQVYMSGHMWAASGKITHRMRQLEKQIRGAAATPPPAGGDPANGDLSPAARAALKAIKKDIRALAKSVSTRKDSRRFFLAWNTGVAQQKADSGSYCFKETGNIAALRRQLEALEKLVRDPRRHDLDGPVTFDNPPDALVGGPEHNPYPPEGMTAEQFAQRVVTSVVMHEVGHTLGLRHNFLGSTEASEDGSVASASIMDYNDLVIDAQFDGPGRADLVVMKSVYGTPEEKAQLPSVAFCSDEEAGREFPACNRFDFAANPLEGLLVQQDTNLKMALMFLSAGQSDVGVDMLRRAVGEVAPILNYVTFPTDAGSLFTRDQDFESKQRQALALYRASKTMLGNQYPADIQDLYSQILIQVLASKATPNLPGSVLHDDVVAELRAAAIDATGTMDLATRQNAILGMRNIQTLTARAQVVAIQTAVAASAQAESRDELQRMEDEEVLTLIRNLLAAGFIRSEN